MFYVLQNTVFQNTINFVNEKTMHARDLAYIYLFILSSPEDMLIDFREREREGKSKGEKRDWLPLIHTPTWDQSSN